MAEYKGNTYLKQIYKWLIISFLICSCDLFDTKNENINPDLIYIALQGLDQVGIVNSENGEMKVVDIDYNVSMNETPHFIIIDEINRYWFVTTIASGFVGRYHLETNKIIDTLFIGDSPALMVANKLEQKLYVSRMMPMGGMAMGSISTIIHEIDYSDPLEMSTYQEIELGSPAPHGIAINSDGSEVFVTSNTADWIYKVTTFTGEINSVVMDSVFNNYPNNEAKRLNPIQCMSINDSLLVIACSAGLAYNSSMGENDTIPGQVQLWNSNSMILLDTLQFNWKSKPWHIAKSPINEEVFVVLAGDVLYSGTAGIACLTYESNNLAIKWQSHSDEFETLHGIDVSNDGERIYVSGRKDGHLHIFDGETGELEQSIPLGNNPSAGGLSVLSSQ